MKSSLRALLSNAIDYAGLFPPASLTLDLALAQYRAYRAEPLSWMLGRFIVPAAKLGELSESYEPAKDGPLSTIAPWGDTEEAFSDGIATAVHSINASPHLAAIDTLEFRWLGDRLRAPPDRIPGLLRAAAWSIRSVNAPRMTLFFELPPPELLSSDDDWRDLLQQSILALASRNLTPGSLDRQAGFKLRCAGTKPAAIPSSAAVAAAICLCRNHALFWKATAGLHHPLRRFDPVLGGQSHGFLNLFTAAVMADKHRLDEGAIQAILDDDDPGNFRFGDESLAWRELSIGVDEIVTARERSLRSFGSCSIEEPWEGLREEVGG